MAVDSSEHVIDLLFMSERCVVTKAASQLMKLVHQILQVVNSEYLVIGFFHLMQWHHNYVSSSMPQGALPLCIHLVVFDAVIADYGKRVSISFWNTNMYPCGAKLRSILCSPLCHFGPVPKI